MSMLVFYCPPIAIQIISNWFLLLDLASLKLPRKLCLGGTNYDAAEQGPSKFV